MNVRKPLIAAISGSTRKSSSNLQVIYAITDLAKDLFDIQLIDTIVDLPQFNPDLIDHVPPIVQDYCAQLKAADGILICTPEYAAGVPGALKNAIDWTVATMEFSQKPVALITASTSGKIAHQSLLGTLLIIESKITEDMQLVIPSIRPKVNATGITDADTLAAVRKVIAALADVIDGKEATFLPPPQLF